MVYDCVAIEVTEENLQNKIDRVWYQFRKKLASLK